MPYFGAASGAGSIFHARDDTTRFLDIFLPDGGGSAVVDTFEDGERRCRLIEGLGAVIFAFRSCRHKKIVRHRGAPARPRYREFRRFDAARCRSEQSGREGKRHGCQSGAPYGPEPCQRLHFVAEHFGTACRWNTWQWLKKRTFIATWLSSAMLRFNSAQVTPASKIRCRGQKPRLEPPRLFSSAASIRSAPRTKGW